MSNPRREFSLEQLREKLKGQEGSVYWRSLEELAETKEFQQMLSREFPEHASEWHDPKGRRRFLKIMGASIALAGLAGCTRQPKEEIVPYVEQPEELVPKKPLFFSTAVPTISGYAEGVVVENYMGRPIKVEGNPDHPANLGATSVWAQASVLQLYDPDRSQAVLNRQQPTSWNRFVEALEEVLGNANTRQGRGIRILTETVTSPTLGDQIVRFLEQYPEVQWHQYEPVAPDASREGVAAAAGQPASPVYRFDKARAILSLDEDFLYKEPGSVRYARDFIQARDPDADMNRLYVVEPTPSVTGGMSDHRLPMPASRIGGVLRGVAERLEVAVPEGLPPLPEDIDNEWLAAVVSDLQEHRGQSVVLAGNTQPAVVHEVVYAVNEALGNIGTTVLLNTPAEYRSESQGRSFARLVEEMRAGEVDALFMLNANPAYYAPANLKFEEALQQVDLSMHLGLYNDETAALSDWHIPTTHYLEYWSDHRSFEGTVSIQQPLIDPLYDACRSVHELMATLNGDLSQTSYNIVQTSWRQRYQGEAFDTFWDSVLHRGLVPPDAPVDLAPPAAVPEAADTPTVSGGTQSYEAGQGDDLEVVFKPDPRLFDGRYANNGWLQELPKPMNKLTWDNAALISPATAERLDLRSEEVVRLQYKGRTVEVPVWVLPGQADDTVTVRLGYGREQAGRVGNGAGFNAYQLRTSDTPWFGRGLVVEKTEQTYPLACRQEHFNMHGRDLVRVGTQEEYLENPHFAAESEENPEPEETLYPQWDYSEGHQWGMSIDLNQCIGCGACTIACQAENNIPVVGKEGVRRQRIMHWIRVDRYFSGDIDNPEVVHQPVPCMHCENAPCEVVCPVNATVHDSHGLNEMIYNRCIGTRYCSNNCPYKVRRFNFFEYNDAYDDVEKLRSNPEVTVRSRGVMEKCTYCIQRIKSAMIEGKKEERPVRDGEIQTACQQACPTNAITFGDVNDPDTVVSQEKDSPRNYPILAELNTRPRTTYLARVKNPNERLPVVREVQEGEEGELDPEALRQVE